MKKILLCFFIFFIIIFSIIKFKNKDEKNSNKITLAEVTHSIFYAPLYVAIENNYFKDEGLEVDLILTSGADKVSAAVLSGDAQIGLAGAESAIYIYNSGEKDYLKIFSGLTKRDGQFILGRKKNDNFDLNNLKGKEKQNIDPKDININYQVDYASLSGAFIGGTGDYVNLFEPNASLLEKNNQGNILLSIGKYSGEMPYTVFYAKKSYIKDNSKICEKFSKAISKGLDYVNNNDAIDTAKIISKQFPDNSIIELETMIKHYKDSDSWLSDTKVSNESLENLENLLIKNKLIKNKIPYNKLVINYEK